MNAKILSQSGTPNINLYSKDTPIILLACSH